MSDSPSFEWSPQQQDRLEGGGVARSVDVHCHLLAGLDDGPDTLEESIALCGALVADGITSVVASPHQLERYNRENTLAVIEAKIAELVSELQKLAIPLEIVPGADVRIDERLAKLLDVGEISTIANLGRQLLLELPHEFIVNPLSTIAMLGKRGIQTIMTHPERHRYLRGSVSGPRSWVQAGAVVQVTAGSLLGEFGNSANEHAWRLVEAGVAGLVASDAHGAQQRPPRMGEALALVSRVMGEEVARRICLENPWRVLKGEVISQQ